jgi:hypothetical protein
MATKIKVTNYDSASTLKRFTQFGNGELKPEPPIAPGQSAELTLSSAGAGVHTVLELSANAEMCLPIQNPTQSLPRTLGARVQKRETKNGPWERTESVFIPPREVVNLMLKGPARVALSEMPT